jgi:hypothetical protein
MCLMQAQCPHSRAAKKVCPTEAFETALAGFPSPRDAVGWIKLLDRHSKDH